MNIISKNKKRALLKPHSRTYLIIDNEQGFALPSVLFLVTILSLVILSILTLHYFQRQNVQITAAKIKADYAAQSGIAKILSEIKSESNLPLIGQSIRRSYDLGDGEMADVTMEWWGLCLYVRSQGSFRRINETRFALTGQTPTQRFKNAMVFSNPNHQLVLTGNAHIKGDVLTGLPGVSTGSISKYPTPRILPVEGKVKQDPKIAINELNIKKHFDYYDALVNGAAPKSSGQADIQYIQSSPKLNISNEIKPETKYVFVTGKTLIEGRLVRHDNPLFIIIDGEVIMNSDLYINGLVCIVSSKRISIGSTAHIDGAVMYSRKEIIVEPNANLTAQIMAPSIQIEQGAVISYPSAVISYVKKDNKDPQKGITLKNGGVIEGNVIVSVEDITSNEVLFNIESSAKVNGFVSSNAVMALEGSVNGCVQTKDFYFYESPTTYYGWLRSARIDREVLPASALTIVGLDGLSKLQILDWL